MKRIRQSIQPLDQQTLFLFILTVLLVFLIMLRTPTDADMWWHLSAGRAMWERGEILRQDIFSYTRGGEPWTNAFWISDLMMYGLHAWGEFLAITVWVSLMATLTMAVVYKHAKSPKPIRVGVVILATLVAAPLWTPRPQLISFFLVAVLDYFLARKDESLNKPFWVLLPLFALWSNFHGGFIFGYLLLAAFIGGKLLEPMIQHLDDWRAHLKTQTKVIGFAILGVFAVGLNPNGLAIWKLPFYTVDVSMAIQEWHSPDFHRFDLHPILWLLFLVIIALGFSSKKISLFDLFKTIGFAYMTFYSQRSMPLFAIVAAPVATRYLAVVWEDWKSAPIGLWLTRLQRNSASKSLPGGLTKIINLTIVALIFTAALIWTFSVSLPVMVYQTYPKAAVSWIEENQLQGQMFNSYNWGGYLTWDLQAWPVFIDGRADLYGDEIIGQWWQIVNATDEGFALLDQWDVNFVLLEPHWAIISALQAQDWSVLYQDDLSILLARPQ
jgi:hypothetical protein